jgi:hypothetical protein
MIIIFIILAFIFIAAYAGAPKWIQFILCLANIFIPDPIPFVDEVIMLAILLKKD